MHVVDRDVGRESYASTSVRAAVMWFTRIRSEGGRSTSVIDELRLRLGV